MKEEIKSRSLKLLKKYFWFSFHKSIRQPFNCTSIEIFDPDNNIVVTGNNDDLSLHLVDCITGDITKWLDLGTLLTDNGVKVSSAMNIWLMSRFKNHLYITIGRILSKETATDKQGRPFYRISHDSLPVAEIDVNNKYLKLIDFPRDGFVISFAADAENFYYGCNPLVCTIEFQGSLLIIDRETFEVKAEHSILKHGHVVRRIGNQVYFFSRQDSRIFRLDSDLKYHQVLEQADIRDFDYINYNYVIVNPNLITNYIEPEGEKIQYDLKNLNIPKEKGKLHQIRSNILKDNFVVLSHINGEDFSYLNVFNIDRAFKSS